MNRQPTTRANHAASEQRDAGRWLAWGAAICWMLGLFVLSGMPAEAAARALDGAAGAVEGVLRMLFDSELSGAARLTLRRVVQLMLPLGAYAGLDGLLWNALRRTGATRRHAMVLSVAGAALFAATDELHQLLVPGRRAGIADWMLDCAGALGMVLLVIACRWARERFPGLINRETVSYVVFGVLTTLVNMAAYGLCYNTLGIHNLVSNAIAWVAAVLFAYVVNKLFVFHSRTANIREALREFGLFIGARALSFGIDELGMGLLVNLMGVNGGVAKIIVNVIVMILNYFFSKWVIFRRPAQGGTNE